MQAQAHLSRKSIRPGKGSGLAQGGTSKFKTNLSQRHSSSRSRTLLGTRTLTVLLDGRNATPLPLIPSVLQDQLKDSLRVEASGDHTFRDPAATPELAKGEWPPTEFDDMHMHARLRLQEATEAPWILSSSVAPGDPTCGDVSARNAAYEESLAMRRLEGSQRAASAQTLGHPSRAQWVSVPAPKQASVALSASAWEICDAMACDPLPSHDLIEKACAAETQAALAQALRKPGALFRDLEAQVEISREASGTLPLRVSRSRLGSLSSTATSRAGVNAASAAAAGSFEIPTTRPSVLGREAETSPALAGAGDPLGSPGGLADAGPSDAIESKPWVLGRHEPVSADLADAARVMERIVVQNHFQEQLLLYRNLLSLNDLAEVDEAARCGHTEPLTRIDGALSLARGEDEAAEDDAARAACWRRKARGKPRLQDLFVFQAKRLTSSLVVTCTEWSHHNPDLLAASYGESSLVSGSGTPDGLPAAELHGEGLVLFWSLKNPTHPERVLRSRRGVTSLNFSSIQPNLLAAGTYDGSVVIWDLRQPSDQPLHGGARSTGTSSKHAGAVWDAHWVDRREATGSPTLGSTGSPTLMSVGGDGGVGEWTLDLGTRDELMSLRRVPNKHLATNCVYGHKEGVVFRRSRGLCLALPTTDLSTYLVGTEDGFVHRCSFTSSEHYIQTYLAHSAAVYKVRCNPFLPDVFLTCSADWRIRLWKLAASPGPPVDEPISTFRSTDLCDAVNDVAWSPRRSTCFAAAADDGRVELWDLSEQALDPIVVHYPCPNGDEASRIRRTSVCFSPKSPVLAAGDSRGHVVVMRIHNADRRPDSDEAQRKRLDAVVRLEDG